MVFQVLNRIHDFIDQLPKYQLTLWTEVTSPDLAVGLPGQL